MRYLRMLTNSIVGGALGAAFVALVFLQINPQLPLSVQVVAPLYGTLATFYGVHLAVGFYVLIVLRQLVGREVLSPGWLSVRILAWLSAALAAGTCLLMWTNLSGFRAVLEPDTARRMAAGAAGMAVCAVLLVFIAVVHYSFGRRGSKMSGSMLALTLVAALALPMVARGRGTAPPPPGGGAAARGASEAAEPGGRLIMVLLDGASLEFLLPLTALGHLPNFGRLIDGGASLHLTTIRPTQPAPVWTAALTGAVPPSTGVRAAATYTFGPRDHPLELLPDVCFAYALVHLGLLDERPYRSTDLRASPVWQVLGRHGITVGVAGVPVTDPAPPVRGYLVSDGAHAAGNARLAAEDQDLAYPRNLFELVQLPASPTAPAVPPPDHAAKTAGDGPPAAGVPPPASAAVRDAWYASLVEALDARFAPRVSMTRYVGIDLAGHYYLRFAQPGAFGDVTAEERGRFGQVLEDQYARVDAVVGRLLDGLAPGDVLFVVSGFGMQPVSLGKRLLGRALGEPPLTGTHEDAPDGFLLAYGTPVASGRLPVGSVLDVAPTMLYFLGVPVGRDLQGVARTDLFEAAFTAERPVTYIPSHR